jgi:toxin ParE1/3/4
MALIWSEEAEADLFDIWDYLAREASPTVADNRLRQIHRASSNLADWPRLGRERSDIRAGLRSIAAPPHVIFYWLQDERVEILRVLHGHMDIERIFSENPPI